MQELKKGDLVNLTNGSQAKIIEELGRGGQGIVYRVEVGNKEMALKWYLNAPNQAFYKNLEENVAKGAPSDAFLWPEYVTKKERGSYGYIMRLRPKGYYEFGQYLLARRQFKSFEAITNAAMKICEGFKLLHLRGYSYQDLNDGNFFINPDNGDVLICDNDNVMPNNDSSGILGKARYMAPEIVKGKSRPDSETDRFSLSVILFMLFYANHPFEGARVLACPCMTEKFEKQFYGEEAVFIYDKDDNSNRPVRGVHNNVLRRWMLLPGILREAFTTEFSKEKLADPTKRITEREWQKIIQSLRDMLVVCPHCGEENFVEEPTSPKCMACKRDFSISGTLQIKNRSILLTPKTNVYIDMDNKPDIMVFGVPGDKYPVQMRNVTAETWVVETQSGKLKQIQPNETMPVRAGLKISIGQNKGQLI